MMLGIQNTKIRAISSGNNQQFFPLFYAATSGSRKMVDTG